MRVHNAAYLIDLAGVAVFAVSGVLAAGRKNLDLFGVLVIATVTAIGGGTIRDLLLGRHPIFWMSDTVYLWVIITVSSFTMIYVHFGRVPLPALSLADALGLALFSIAGAQIAERFGHAGMVAVILGTITGAAGGVIRDILLGEIPLILRNRELYATAAILGIAAYLGLESLGVNRPLAAYVGMAVVAGIRFGSIFWDLRVPAFRLSSDKKTR